jgi:REP element-mobilizing transposase RayT
LIGGAHEGRGYIRIRNPLIGGAHEGRAHSDSGAVDRGVHEGVGNFWIREVVKRALRMTGGHAFVAADARAFRLCYSLTMTRFPPARNRRLATEVYEEALRPCFLTIRAASHCAPFIAPELNDEIVAVLNAERLISRCQLYAFCLMPDHLHLLVAPESSGASVLIFTDRFKGRSTNASWKFGWRGRLWQPRSFDRVLRREESILSVCEYIIANPVRRGLVQYPDEYRWSGMIDPIP